MLPLYIQAGSYLRIYKLTHFDPPPPQAPSVSLEEVTRVRLFPSQSCPRFNLALRHRGSGPKTAAPGLPSVLSCTRPGALTCCFVPLLGHFSPTAGCGVDRPRKPSFQSGSEPEMGQRLGVWGVWYAFYMWGMWGVLGVWGGGFRRFGSLRGGFSLGCGVSIPVL